MAFTLDIRTKSNTVRVRPTLKQETIIEGYQYCTSLDRAFQSLTGISENFNNFVLTIEYTAVAAIYCKGDVGLKTFDSHARGWQWG